jgi:diaminopimelate epimerase
MGAEETNACGSGITSSFYVLNQLGLVGNTAFAITLLGDMEVYLENKSIFIKSIPNLVYKGVIDL